MDKSEKDLLTPQNLEDYIDAYCKRPRPPIDKGSFIQALKELYRRASLQEPEVIFVRSPREAAERAIALNLLSLLKDPEWKKVGREAGVSETKLDRYVNCTAQGISEEAGLSKQEFDCIDSAVKDLLDSNYRENKKHIKQSVGKDFIYTYWLQGTLAFADACEKKGLKIKSEAALLLQNFAQMMSCAVVYNNLTIVSENPLKIHRDDATGALHNDTGPAIYYEDGFSVWMIKGVKVTEQIVLHPETLTLKQILNEENAEVKRVMIERYGWTRYLKGIKAQVVDVRTVTLPQGSLWMESLMAAEDSTIKVLCTYDPSTGRPYSLEVSSNCETCEDAQRYLMAPDLALNGVRFKPSVPYPVLRT